MISIFGLFKISSITNINLQIMLNQYLPASLFNKFNFFDLSKLNSLPRFEIWSKSITFISNNLFSGYGAGSFSNMYNSFNGNFKGIQHTHNLFLELAFNHGLLVFLIILFLMVSILFSASRKYYNERNSYNGYSIDKAWIISFSNFLLIHMFDITYFDGRISLLSWTLLAGLRSITKEKIKL